MDNINISRIFVSFVELIKVLEDGSIINAWISNGAVANLRKLILQFSNYRMDNIPRHWNRIAIALAARGTNLIPLSLFHIGMEKPRWLMKITQDAGFRF